jgi:hypothetical protein
VEYWKRSYETNVGSPFAYSVSTTTNSTSTLAVNLEPNSPIGESTARASTSLTVWLTSGFSTYRT